MANQRGGLPAVTALAKKKKVWGTPGTCKRKGLERMGSQWGGCFSEEMAMVV